MISLTSLTHYDNSEHSRRGVGWDRKGAGGGSYYGYFWKNLNILNIRVPCTYHNILSFIDQIFDIFNLIITSTQTNYYIRKRVWKIKPIARKPYITLTENKYRLMKTGISHFKLNLYSFTQISINLCSKHYSRILLVALCCVLHKSWWRGAAMSMVG